MIHYCYYCGAELKDQWGFDEDDYWTCQSCNTEIYKDDEAYCLVDSSAEDDDAGKQRPERAESVFLHQDSVTAAQYQKGHHNRKGGTQCCTYLPSGDSKSFFFHSGKSYPSIILLISSRFSGKRIRASLSWAANPIWTMCARRTFKPS